MKRVSYSWLDVLLTAAAIVLAIPLLMYCIEAISEALAGLD